MNQISPRKVAIAVSTVVCTGLLSFSLSIDKAQATRLLVHPYYHHYYHHYYHPYYDVTTSHGLPWYAVRAYYAGGPWSGPGFSYSGWDDYAARYGIACHPGAVIKGGDGVLYVCQ